MNKRLALLLLASATFARATQAAAPDPGTAPPVIAGDAGTFTLRDGATITGRVLRTGEGGILLELSDDSQLRFPSGALSGLTDARGRAGENTRVRATLRDGRSVEGTVHGRGDPGLTLLQENGDRLTMPWGDVRSLEYLGSISTGPSWARAPADGPARNRTLFAPTAFLLSPAEVQLSITGIVQPTLTVGILPFLGASAWTVIPVMEAKDHPATGALLLNGGFSPLKWLHLMAGVQGVVESGGLTVAPVVSVTFGSARAYANVALAPSPVGAARWGQFEKGAVAVSGGLGLTSWGMLLAEAWLGTASGGGVSVQAGGAARVWWGVVGAELGVMWTTGGSANAFASLVLDMDLGASKESR